MKKLTNGSAIEGEVLPPSFKVPKTREFNANPQERKLGYVKNPDSCLHNNRAYCGGLTGWYCLECGIHLTSVRYRYR